MKVLITGAAGNLGTRLREYLGRQPDYTLTLLDQAGNTESGIVAADLAGYDDDWAGRFRDQNVVVHLAAQPTDAAWNVLQRNNVDATLNVFRAAAENGVNRVVFASTGRGFLGHPPHIFLAHDAVPMPVDPYAMSKLFGERLGRHYADRFGMSVICLRIGTIRPGANTPPDNNTSRRRWLSTRDFCDAVERSLHARNIGFAALFLCSDNVNKPWDLSETSRLIGFEPRDSAPVVRYSLVQRVRRRLNLYRRRLRRFRNR